MEYEVTIQRTIVEETTMTIEAESAAEASELAQDCANEAARHYSWFEVEISTGPVLHVEEA